MVKDRRMVVREPFHHPLDNKYSYTVSESVGVLFMMMSLCQIAITTRS